MRVVILEVLSNPLLWGRGHSGDLTADFAPVVGNLTSRFVKFPIFPHRGMKLTSTLLVPRVHNIYTEESILLAYTSVEGRIVKL